MSDTPETDAAQHEGLLRTNPIPMQVVTANFARKLEQERDEARELLASEKITRDHIIKRGIEMQKERDEARERERVAIASWDEERQRALREGERVLEARRERNEAHKIAERAIDDLAWFNETNSQRLRTELKKLKEASK
jgi:hypothetical protein